jgi:hypothetical protein
MSKRINVAALQSVVEVFAFSVETVLTEAVHGCLPLAALTEALRETAVGAHLDAEEQRAVEAALRLDPALSSEEESRIRKDAAESLVAAFVRLCPELGIARKRGVGWDGERSAPKVKQPGVRKEAQKREGRIQTLRDLLAAGVPLGDALMAELAAFDAAKKAS